MLLGNRAKSGKSDIVLSALAPFHYNLWVSYLARDCRGFTCVSPLSVHIKRSIHRVSTNSEYKVNIKRGKKQAYVVK